MICGDGDLKKKMIEIAERTGVRNKIISVGIVSEEEKKNYYAAGDIFVYSSKSETQGMIITEAMYSGLPIVAVRATGVKDIVEDGRTGFLVSENKKEFGEAVQKLIDSPELRTNFGDASKKIAKEKYTSSVSAKRMLEVYEKEIASHK